MDDEKPIKISQASAKRLISDIKSIIKEPLEKQGIYYKHDEVDMLKGYAMIIGPADSVYENGYYFFEFNFPTDYPFSPPKLKYCTNDGCTRFHPNLYKNGKVCLSILNTWRGPAWTSCQTISTILLTLLSILDNSPLLNEPGVTETYKDVPIYNEIIRYKNIEFSILEIMKEDSRYRPKQFNVFLEPITKHFEENKERIKEIISEKKLIFPLQVYKTSIYSLTTTIDYESLLKKYNRITGVNLNDAFLPK